VQGLWNVTGCGTTSAQLAEVIAQQIRNRRTGAIARAVRLEMHRYPHYLIHVMVRYQAESVWGYPRFEVIKSAMAELYNQWRKL
jgi:hypothetical protein